MKKKLQYIYPGLIFLIQGRSSSIKRDVYEQIVEESCWQSRCIITVGLAHECTKEQHVSFIHTTSSI